jgi:hypothetical protein
VRSSRSHASWTTSSASPDVAELAVREPHQARSGPLESSAVEQLVRVALRGQRGRRDAAAGDRRILVEPTIAAVGVHERDRFLHESLDASGSRGARDRGSRGLGAHAVVLRPGG